MGAVGAVGDDAVRSALDGPDRPAGGSAGGWRSRRRRVLEARSRPSRSPHARPDWRLDRGRGSSCGGGTPFRLRSEGALPWRAAGIQVCGKRGMVGRSVDALAG